MPSIPSDAAVLAGQVVVFTGKLSSLARKDAQALVARLGGAPQDEVTASTTMLVVGAAGFPSPGTPRGARTGEDPDERSRKLKRAQQVNAARPGRIQVITEDEFCQRAGVRPPGALKQQYYAASDIRAMYPRLRDDHLRYLEKWNLVRPVLRTHAERYFGFPDLAVIRQVSAEMDRGVPFRSALRAAHAERAGQLALDFRHEAEPAKVIRLTTARRRPDPAAGARDPHDAERLFLAASALDDGDPAFRREAADAYLQVLALDPTLAPALINLGNLHYADDRLADAQVLYERALTLEPDVFEAHYNLGNIHHDLGRFEEARRSYVRALALNPTYADGHFYLAVTLEKLGRSSEAKLHWRAYQQLAPGGEWIELAREFSE